MEAWIRLTFQIEPDSWVDPDDGIRSDAFCFTGPNGYPTKASLSAFISLFGSVVTPPTAAALKASDPNDVAGWHATFDAWVEQGILPQ